MALQSFHMVQSACDVDECTFESGACSWTATPSRTFQVTRARYTENPLGGDHTSGSPSGKVMYFSGKSNTTVSGNVQAQLTSRSLSNLRWQCFSFWYLLKAGNSSTSSPLSLKLFTVQSLNKIRSLLWTSSSSSSSLATLDPTGEWTRALVSVNIRGGMNLDFEVNANGKFVGRFVF